MTENDPFTANPVIIPQNYPLWVEDWTQAETYFHYPIIGWVWKSDGGSKPYLHPVVVDECGAIPYESDPNRNWSIVDHKQERA